MKKIVLWCLFILVGMSSCKETCDPINAELTGKWERIDGDNSPFNGMVVDFSGNVGALTTIPTTAYGFVLNDAKWRNVVQEQTGVYKFEDRNSAGGYVPSRIFVLADGQELMLSASAGSLGNYQKWRRL